jgi:poly-gamma-glutamate synthesis protein (capsule biosynthesis protein)
VTRISLAAVGDVMLGDHPVRFGHGVGTAIKKRGFGSLLADAKPILAAHDIFFFNLETVMSGCGLISGSLESEEMRADPQLASELRICGHNVASVANNHILQHGIDCFHDTCDTLRKNNIGPIGLMGPKGSVSLNLSVKGVQVAFFGYSLRPEKYSQKNPVYAQVAPEVIIHEISEARRQDLTQVIVVSLHWGEEYLRSPSNWQVDFARSLVDAGATVILGHHPHVLQPIERYKSSLIAYSLGNFVFDSWQVETRKTGVLICHLSAEGVIDYEFTPMFIESNYRINPRSRRVRDIEAELNKAQKGLPKSGDGADPALAKAYAKLASAAYFRYRMECYLYFVTHLWKYDARTIWASFFRFARRRLSIES